jgi:hypothetical protein
MLPLRLPPPADWRAAAELLEREARAGDAVALSPWWAERARQLLPERFPVLARPSLADDDLVGVERVWLLDQPASPGHRDALRAELERRAAPAAPTGKAGRIELTPFALRSATLPLAFLPDLLATATVAVGTLPCRPDAGLTFRCPAPPFVVVATQVRELAFAPRRCIYAHPSPDRAAPLTVTFGRVPLGRRLRGHTGIAGEAAWWGEAPVRLAIRVDGEEVGAFDEPPGQPGWHAFEVDTARFGGRPADLSFTVTAADVRARHFCFDAFTLP